MIDTTFLTTLETAVSLLTQSNSDGCAVRNDVGWSSRDQALGHNLCRLIGGWSPGQIDAAWKICSNYRNTQLSHLEIPAYAQTEVSTRRIHDLVLAREAKRAETIINTPGWGLTWSNPRDVLARGERKSVTTAKIPSNHPFWSIWRTQKAELQAQGYGVSQYQGDWAISKWGSPSAPAAPAPVATPYQIRPLTQPQGLRAYQIPSAERLLAGLRTFGAALDASDTGTGKTFTALAVCRELGVSPVVIAPKAVLPAWHKAAALVGVTIRAVNYEKVRRGNTELGKWGGSEAYPTFIWSSDIQFLVFDEIHRCKGHKTDNGKLVIGAKSCGIRALGLSRTAATDPLELKALGYLLGLHDLKGFWKWTESYGCGPSRHGGYEFYGGANDLARLHAQIFPQRGSRVRIADLGDAFPETSITTDLVEVSNAAAIDRAFESVSRAKSAVAKKVENDPEHHLTKILRARQLAELGKVQAILEIGQDALEQGSSVAVFVNFSDTLKVLAEQFAKAGWPTVALHGGQTSKEQAAAIAAFQADPNQPGAARVIVANTKVGGVGVSLHDLYGVHPRLALISPTDSAVDLQQALGRVHRDGGKTKSIQRILFAGGTVEERVEANVRSKLANLDALNDGDLQTESEVSTLQGLAVADALGAFAIAA